MSAAVYSQVDIWTDVAVVDFGPGCDESLPRPVRSSVARDATDQVAQLHFLPPCPSQKQQFGHEWLGHAGVEEFRKLLPFEVDAGESVFELSQKVRSLTNHGPPQFSEINTDPLEYLQLALEHQDLNCRYFSVIFEATARLAGYTTRLISLSKTGLEREHAVSEVYVPQFGKWILIDCDFNVAYQRDGVWLNAFELNTAWHNIKAEVRSKHLSHQNRDEIREHVKKLTKIEVVELGPASKELRQTNMYRPSLTGMNLEFYEFVLYSVRNDYLSASYPPGHPIRSTEYYVDLGSKLDAPPNAPEAIRVTDLNKLYWAVGQSRIEPITVFAENSSTYEFELSTWTPNFAGFEYRFGNDEWEFTFENRVKRSLQAGIHSVEARSLNSVGLRGEVVRLQIEVPDQQSTNDG